MIVAAAWKYLILLAHPTRLERVTFAFGVRRSRRRQPTYQPEPRPADFTPEKWAAAQEFLQLVKPTVPMNEERPPSEILGVIGEALLKHFRALNGALG